MAILNGKTIRANSIQVTNNRTDLKLTVDSSPLVVVLGDLEELALFSSLPEVLHEIKGTSGSEQLIGTNSDDEIRGFEGRDTLSGGAGNDILIGGLNGDHLTGGEGSDRFVFDSFDERTDTIADFNVNEDMLVLTNLFANLNYNGVNPIADGYLQFVQDGASTKVQVDPDGVDGPWLFTTVAILEQVTPEPLNVVVLNQIIGTSGKDKLNGTDGSDIIMGLEGADTLIGGAGDDILVGSLDGDRLTGGKGSDHFVYNSFDDYVRTDRISDFNVNEDKLVLKNLFVELNYTGFAPIADGYLKFAQQGLNTRVQINPDGVDGSLPFTTIAILDNVKVANLVVGSNVII
jgi:Ca2+-binding RTX toxin-like protein